MGKAVNMTKYTYEELKKEKERARKDGLSSGSEQGKRDMLAKLRTWLTEEERRLSR